MTPLTALARAAMLALVTLALAACSGSALSPGLSARMDAPGAHLDRAEALGIINHYRSTIGAPPLADDPTLDAQAQQLATQYARTGRQSGKPEGTIQVRYSAGSATFADTFSGWRSSPENSAALSDKSATRAGIAAIYDVNTPYGVYWVMIVG